MILPLRARQPGARIDPADTLEPRGGGGNRGHPEAI